MLKKSELKNKIELRDKSELNKKIKINNNIEIDKARPNCAVVGVFGHNKAALITYYALHSLQHRGQEASGIVSIYFDEEKKRKRFAYTRDEGLVIDVFKDKKLFDNVLIGDSAIGHNRYSTTGSSSKANIQPFNMIYHSGILAVSHNGNLTNTISLRKQLQDDGAIFQTTTDTELFLHLVARSKEKNQIAQIREALKIAEGAYSLCILTEDALIVARDPHGFRPMNIGRIKLENGKYAFIAASETCAFDIVDAEYIRSVEHNEIVIIDRNSLETSQMQSFKIIDKTPIARHCIFEYIYFSRPDSMIFGHSVDKIRRKLGKNLGAESPVIPNNGGKATVIAVPDSGNTATLGFARKNADFHPTQFEIGLIRSHYIGRTFIAPEQESRVFKVKAKFNPVRGIIEGRNVVIVDDSIVRGTTTKSLVKLIRSANPKELHCRISSPPIKFPCYYGMDFPDKNELIANDYENEEKIGEAIGVDSLHYLSEKTLLESVPHDEGIDYCTACFTGIYPIPVEQQFKSVNE